MERPGLARFQVPAVERVRLLGGGVARVLAQRPRAAGVHRRPRTADEWGEARQRVEVLQPFEILGGVERLYVDAFGGPPRQIARRPASGLLLDERRPCFQIRLHVIGHGVTSCPQHARMQDHPAAREPRPHGSPGVSGRMHPYCATSFFTSPWERGHPARYAPPAPRA